MEENNNGSFFTSNIFKWILIIVFEIISIVTFVLLLPKPDNMKDANGFAPVIIYFIVCIIISLGIIFKLNKRVDKYQQKNRYKERQVDNFVSEATGFYVQPDSSSDRKTNRIAIVAALSVILSPFIAPYVLGTLVFTIVCKAAEKK